MALAYETGTLESGLRVVVVPQPQLTRAHVALYVKVGSRYESAAENGLSHFLEHMIYRGTARLRSAHAVNDAFETIGGYLYAATHPDFGVFSVSLPRESLDKACDLFGEVLREPLFLDMDVEKGIVCEEILEDLDDEGRQVDPDNLSRTLVYPDHPLGFTITGDIERVRGFTPAQLAAHKARHYTATSVLAFSGAVDPRRAMDLARTHFGWLPRAAPIPVVPPPMTPDKARLLIVDNQGSQTDLRLCLRTLGEHTRMRPAIEMMMRILDDGMSTRLYHRLCDDKGLCYDVSAAYDGYEDDGILDFAAGVQHARAALVTQEILALMTELATTGPTEEELAKARRRHAWDVEALRDSPEEAAAFFAGGLLFDRFQSPEDRKATLARVTCDEIREVARAIVRPERLSVVAVGLLERDEEKRLEDFVLGWKGGGC